jgi:glycosyltransferase involved in cell wall biosynthesis
MPLLSVIIPVYNEAKTIGKILEKIDSLDLDKEIIVVDDGSCDGTDKVLRSIKYNNLKIIHHTSNRGKGAAFLTGLANAAGEFIIIQDADLEYDPKDYLKLLGAIEKDKAELVLGARFIKGYRGLFMHRLGNRAVTGFMNLLFNANLNDAYTCYKLLRRDTINTLELKSRNFNIEAEIVAKALKKKLRIVEVSISYYPRHYSEGKKIRWIDGLKAIMAILRYRFINE